MDTKKRMFGYIHCIYVILLTILCWLPNVCSGVAFDRREPNRGVINDCTQGWYRQYMAREKISDPDNLPIPSQERIDIWKKKFLSVPYPPRYMKSRQTKDEQKVGAALRSYYEQLVAMSKRVEVAYVAYLSYGLADTKINAVCKKIQEATQVRAWKDYWERTTSFRKRAEYELQKVVMAVDVEVDELFKKLVEIKEREYDAWAKAHPQAAMVIANNRRLAEVERQARAAEQRAKQAEYAALAAQAAASAARSEAEMANMRAAEAESNAAAAARARQAEQDNDFNRNGF